MSSVTLLIPLRLPPELGFFNPDETGQADSQTILGYKARLKIDPPKSANKSPLLPPYSYLEVQDVPADRADHVLNRVRRCLKWASVRLDMGIDTDQGPLRNEAREIIDGQFATAYPSAASPKLIRMEASARSEEPSTRLFAAINEAANLSAIADPDAKKSTLLACEFFAAAEFELTANAKFIMLATVYEVLADPKRRPSFCVYLVEEFLEKIIKAEAIAKLDGDNVMSEALGGLRNATVHYREESISSAIRKLATKTSLALGDLEPDKKAKRATELYAKRSQLVHQGESVSWPEVAELRQFAREALAVEVGCYERIRERYP